MIDKNGREWVMNEEVLEVFKVIPFKRKRKIKSKRRFYQSYILVWNPYIRKENLTC